MKKNVDEKERREREEGRRRKEEEKTLPSLIFAFRMNYERLMLDISLRSSRSFILIIESDTV